MHLAGLNSETFNLIEGAQENKMIGHPDKILKASNGEALFLDELQLEAHTLGKAAKDQAHQLMDELLLLMDAIPKVGNLPSHPYLSSSSYAVASQAQSGC